MNHDSIPTPSSSKGSTVRAIALASNGDREALGEVFRKFNAPLAQFIAGHTRGIRSADENDIVQKVFTKLLEAPQKLNAEMTREDAFALLCRIGIHAAIDYRRSGGKHKTRGGSALVLFDGLSDDQADRIIEADLSDKMRDCAFGEKSPLSPELKSWLELFLAGKSSDEIATELQCSERTVRRRKDEAFRRMKAVVREKERDTQS